MWHRDPKKYKEYERKGNIIIGKAELYKVIIDGKEAYSKVGGGYIYDLDQAIEYAKRLDRLLSFNMRRVQALKNRQVPYNPKPLKTVKIKQQHNQKKS